MQKRMPRPRPYIYIYHSEVRSENQCHFLRIDYIDGHRVVVCKWFTRPRSASVIARNHDAPRAPENGGADCSPSGARLMSFRVPTKVMVLSAISSTVMNFSFFKLDKVTVSFVAVSVI